MTRPADAILDELSVEALISRELDPLFLNPERTDVLSAWWAHVPFAFWAVAACRPRLLVELGVHSGVSYAALCEAVLQRRLETRCYGIDTWTGDAHTQAYDEEVYQDLRAFHDKRYAAFSELIRTEFDAALTHFEDGSIDLLHIDGYHTYESVRHDFETWRAKLSDRAVVILHDTNVRERDFGVWRYFAEVASGCPSFEFLHGHGLGVLAVGPAAPPAILRLCSIEVPDDVTRVRERFAHLGARWAETTRAALAQQAEAARSGQLRATQSEAERVVAQAEARAAEAQSQARSAAADAEAAARARSEVEQALADAERRAAEARIAAERAGADADERIAAAVAQAEAARADERRAAAEADARVAEANRTLLAMRNRLTANIDQIRIDYEAQVASTRREIDALRNSTIWRASAPLRALAAKTPSSLKPVLRQTARSVYWVITPWGTARRIRFLREQAQQRNGTPSVVSPAERAVPAPQPLAAAATPRPEVAGGGAAASGDLALARPTAMATPGLAGASRLSIVFVSGEPDTPGHRYRVLRYMEAAIANQCGVTSIRGDELAQRFAEVYQADVLVVWRMSWSADLAAAVDAMRARGKKVVFDVDDLMVDPELAQVDIIDGIRSQFLTEEAVRGHYSAIRTTMLAADSCFAATDELALHMRRVGKVAHVLPNGFDAATHDFSRRAARRWRHKRDDTLIRIGYACGSRTHQRDLGVAIDAIARLLRENPSCRLVLFQTAVGGHRVIDIDEYPAMEGLADRIEWRPLRRLEELAEEIARFDVNLAPLEYGNPFCEAKSELKFFEAALVGVPTIASPTGPYRRAIAHGRTGFLAASADDWYTYAKRMIDDPALRDRVGRAAYLASLARFGPLSRASRFALVIDQLLGGPAAATAFALEAQLGSRTTPAPVVVPCDTVFEHDALGQADVTVVVPLYNYENYLGEALDSVREQTLPLDLIIIDDCSTDRSLAVATAWAKKNAARFNRIQILKNQANSGLALSRNTAFAHTETRYVLPLDPDNKLLPQCCEKLLHDAESSRAAFVYGTIECFGGPPMLLSNMPYAPQRFVAGNYIDAMALVSKEAWAMVGGYQPFLGWEDYDFWCRLAEHNLRGEWHPEVVALYRIHESSMLRTLTDVDANHRRLVEEFKARHPWVVLLAQEKFRHKPQPSLSLTDGDRRTRLHDLLPILRCPETGQKLVLTEDGASLMSVDGLRRWPIVEGRPVLFPDLAAPEVRPVEHLSNPLPDNALDLIRATRGLVLNLSAGGSTARFDHVVEAEFAIFRHTDVVADAHRLPFDDDVFEAVVVMNAFEHYRDPVTVAGELYRILKPGGRILIRTAFMQPLHERPWHFYNCTRYGLEQWFKAFETDVLHVSENFCPSYSVAWLASEAEAALRAEVSPAAADAFSTASFGTFAEMWRNPAKQTGPLWNGFYRLSQATQEITAAGFEFSGRKPLRRRS